MNKIIKCLMLLIFLIVISGCSSTERAVSANEKDIALSNIWVASMYRPVSSGDSSIKLYVYERKNGTVYTNVADYFLIVHEGSGVKESGIVSKNNLNVVSVDLTSEMIGGHRFLVSLKTFDSIRSDKGSYYEIIKMTSYSAPDCGISKEYLSENKNFKVTIIDAVSCGQLHLETGNRNSSEEYEQRLKNLTAVSYQSFSYISR